MVNPVGFLDHPRLEPRRRPVAERVLDFREVEAPLPLKELLGEAGRCLDCGIPFCHSFGCPLYNPVPDFHDLLCRGQEKEALQVLHSANNFPEITGRICPAPCEAACTLASDFGAVSIRRIELALAERGFEEGWITPRPAPVKTGKKVVVIGSGPAGLAASQQLARAGHEVVVLERSDSPGGLLRYGIPDFKLEKRILDRRLEQLRAEGVKFENGVEAGVDLSGSYLRRNFDAVLIAVGAGLPRDLDLPGRDLPGVHLALDYLRPQNQAVAGGPPPTSPLSARGKTVVVIGGGDTGSDCGGTARRQGAEKIYQLEILPRPPAERSPGNPWPEWPEILRTSTSQEEGVERLWSVGTREFLGEEGTLRRIGCVRLNWAKKKKTGKLIPSEIPGSEFELPADLVLLALGFLHVEAGPLLNDLGVKLDQRGNIAADNSLRASVPGIFAAGDAVTGASLVVRALAHGRSAAASIDDFLKDGKR